MLPLLALTVVSAPLEVERVIGPGTLLRLDRWWSLGQGLLTGLLVGAVFETGLGLVGVLPTLLLHAIVGGPPIDLPALAAFLAGAAGLGPGPVPG